MKRLDKNALTASLVILFALMVSRVFAQEDTSRVVTPDSGRYTVRVPDVIIYGEDVARQRGGVKLGEGEIKIFYPQLRTSKPLAEMRFPRLSSASIHLRPLLSQVYSGYGRFRTFLLGGGWAQSVGDFNYRLRASYENSGGHQRYADHWSLEMGSSLGYSLTHYLNLSSDLSYSKRGLGLYGFPIPRRRRNLQRIDSAFALKGNGRYGWGIGLRYQESKVEDEKGGMPPSSSREEIWGVRLYGLANYRSISFFSHTQFQRFKLEEGKNLWETRVECQLPLTKKGHWGTGLREQILRPGKKGGRLSPIFYLNYIPTGEVGFALHLSGGIASHLLQDSFSLNPYFHFPRKERWEDVRIRFSLEVELEARKGLFLKDVVIHQQIKDFLFWEGDSGLFKLGSFPEIRSIENRLLLKFTPYPKLNLKFSLMLRDADLTRGNTLSTWHIPYWEKLGISLTLDFPLVWGINCWLGSEYHGRRYSSATSGDHLSPYNLVNIRINKNLNGHFKVFFEGNNLTNSTYEIWRDYPQPGINGLLGLSFKW